MYFKEGEKFGPNSEFVVEKKIGMKVYQVSKEQHSTQIEKQKIKIKKFTVVLTFFDRL